MVLNGGYIAQRERGRHRQQATGLASIEQKRRCFIIVIIISKLDLEEPAGARS